MRIFGPVYKMWCYQENLRHVMKNLLICSNSHKFDFLWCTDKKNAYTQPHLSANIDLTNTVLSRSCALDSPFGDLRQWFSNHILCWLRNFRWTIHASKKLRDSIPRDDTYFGRGGQPTVAWLFARLDLLKSCMAPHYSKFQGHGCGSPNPYVTLQSSFMSGIKNRRPFIKWNGWLKSYQAAKSWANNSSCVTWLCNVDCWTTCSCHYKLGLWKVVWYCCQRSLNDRKLKIAIEQLSFRSIVIK